MSATKPQNNKWLVGTAITLVVLCGTAIWNTSQLSAKVDANEARVTNVERMDTRMQLLEQSNARIEVTLKFHTQILEQLREDK